ncbi:hypothetical protein Pcinc_016974, partial [Petrolisthes cinctipes]
KVWLRRYEEEGHVKTRPRRGRSRLTSPEDDRRLQEAANMNSQITAVILTREVEMPCHVVITRRRLRGGGLRCHVPAVKEQLTENNKVARLRFAERYVNENLEFWRYVIFSDEKTFTSISAVSVIVGGPVAPGLRLKIYMNELRVAVSVCLSTCGCGLGDLVN